VDFDALPAAACLAAVTLPQNVLVGEPFVLSVTLENASRQAAETVTVRVSAERGLEPAQVEQPVGVLAAGAQQSVEMRLALADTETWAWVEVLTAGQVTDLRLVRFTAQEAGSAVQAQEKTGPDWFLIGGGGLLLLAALLLLIWLVSRGRKNIKPVTPAGPAVFCAYCGSPLAPQARFCPNCGRERVE
jgi:hypothetical protein